MSSELARILPIRPHLWAIDEIGKTLMYVYEGSQRVLLLDTGFGLLPLRSMVDSLCPGKEMIVVNTHAHGDHNSGNAQFSTVGVGRMDEPFSHEALDSAARAHFIGSCFEGNPRAAGADLSLWQPGPSARVIPLSDGDTLSLGDIELTVLETPGHTTGSICLFDAANGLLFTGDLMLTWEVWGQLARSSTLLDYARSLKRLAALESQVSMVLPAHGVADNPFAWPLYFLPPEALRVYAQGTQRILHGETVGTPYSCPAGDGLCARFEIGGIVYDPHRLGTGRL